MMAPWARGHGHSTRALRLACTLGLHRRWACEVITWYAYVGNEASRRAARASASASPMSSSRSTCRSAASVAMRGSAT